MAPHILYGLLVERLILEITAWARSTPPRENACPNNTPEGYSQVWPDLAAPLPRITWCTGNPFSEDSGCVGIVARAAQEESKLSKCNSIFKGFSHKALEDYFTNPRVLPRKLQSHELQT
jgi:hypothetical protein